MKYGFKIILIAIVALHGIFYGLWISAIIINPEMWFFGEKFSGNTAIVIHLGIGILGMFFGGLIYKKKKFAYFGSIFLFGFVLSGILVNHFTCWESGLHC